MRGTHGAETLRGCHARSTPRWLRSQPAACAGRPFRWWAMDRRRSAGRHPLFGARFAAARELPPIGPLGGRIPLILRRALRIIESLRSDNLLYDLFGDKMGSVSMLEIDGEKFFGSNSSLPLYTSRDERDADALREVLLRKYPELRRNNVGQKPLDALYRAETNVLLRAARKFGGTLAGRRLEVVTDRRMCGLSDSVAQSELGVRQSNGDFYRSPRGSAHHA